MRSRSRAALWQRVLVTPILVLAGTAASLAIIELGFHVYHALYPTNTPGFFWEPHPDYGWRHPPARRGLWYDKHGEFKTTVRINSKGLRDVEHTYEKPRGVFRILILGDSYMEALQVELEETFARLLEERLNQQTTTRVEVINSGVSSYGTDNELLYFRHEGYKYQPDLVLLAFTTCNDVRESYEPWNRKTPHANLAKPYFTLNSAGRLQMHSGEPPPPPPPWWRKTYLGQYLYQRLGGQILLPGPHRGIPPPSDPRIPYVPWDMLVYAPDSEEVKMAWRVTQELVKTLRDEVTARGAKFAVMLVNGPWVHDDRWWGLMMMRHPLARKTWDRQRPNRIIGAFLWQEHIPSVDLFDAFEAAKDKGPLFFQFDPHWTAAGHKVAAETVAQFLVRQRLVPVKEPFESQNFARP